MAKSVIIVESPAKVKTIKKFLDSSYTVLASVGHIRDLPSNTLGIDENNDFTPHYQILENKEDVVEKLKRASKNAVVYLAPDPDREGEAIAWHIKELVKDEAKEVKRIQFNEITKQAITEALQHPRDINQHLVDAQQTRRILDRLVGYKVSPLLWKKVKRGISAGRVQSVALRLIVERGKERKAFVPEEYWTFRAFLINKEGEEFTADLIKIQGKKPVIPNQEEADRIYDMVKNAPFVIHDIKQEKKQKKPLPPFITSTLQQIANQKLNYSSKRTMSAAQKLYEGVDLAERGTVALITYMRTDSVRVADEAKANAKQYITEHFGSAYLPKKENVYKVKGSAQDAHEAIRPIDVTITPDEVKDILPTEQYQLYKLIWQRFVASQMAPADYMVTTALLEANQTEWKASGEQILFDGFLSVYNIDITEDNLLPQLAVHDEPTVKEIQKQQKFTQPPALYTESTLIKALEEKGIGRPSTYATIISTLQEREYVLVKNKHFIPTDLGVIVAELLVDNFADMMNVSFTADMEDSLDKIADGREQWLPLMHTFYDSFMHTVEKASTTMESRHSTPSGIPCTSCGASMVIRFGKNGSFLACEHYPECKETKNFTRNEEGEIEIIEKEAVQQVPVGTCPECGSMLYERQSRAGSKFIACSSYPKCTYTKSVSLGIPCPQENCSGEIVERTSKRGKIFYACSAYPECTYALWDKPIASPCEVCHFPITTMKTTKKGSVILCPNPECKHKKAVEE